MANRLAEFLGDNIGELIGIAGVVFCLAVLLLLKR